MRAAAVQMTSTDDLDRNLETAGRPTRAAARDRAAQERVRASLAALRHPRELGVPA